MRRPGVDVEGIATLGAAVSRVSNVGAALFLRDRRPQGGLPLTLAWVWGAASAAGVVDIVRTRRYRRGWIVLDSVLCVATNLATAKHPDLSAASWEYFQAQSLVVTTAVTAGFSPLGVGAVALATGACLYSSIVRRGAAPRPATPVVAPALELVAAAFGLALASDQFRRLEAEAGRLEQRARDHAAAAAVEAERARQHRLLHDTVLQTLEGVAGDWQAGDEALRQLAAADAARLRSAIAGDDAPARLGAELAALIRLYERLGLDVSLDATALDGSPGAAVTEALTAATREALQNVLKHAGPCTVRVAAEVDPASVTITVRDDGAGFDPQRDPEGYGIAESIRARMAAVAGTAEVESVPGLGTTVRLRAPLG